MNEKKMSLSESPMSLSSAIVLGSLLGPQVFGYMRGDDGEACALGAAANALGFPLDWRSPFVLHGLSLKYPELDQEARCPACSLLRGIWRRWREFEFDLGDVIVHLNDDHEWTRQRIADWLAPRETTTTDRLCTGTKELAEVIR